MFQYRRSDAADHTVRRLVARHLDIPARAAEITSLRRSSDKLFLNRDQR